MDDSVPLKRISLGTAPNGKRKHGNPIFQWLDEDEKVINYLGLKKIKGNLESWRDFLKGVKILL